MRPFRLVCGLLLALSLPLIFRADIGNGKAKPNSILETWTGRILTIWSERGSGNNRSSSPTYIFAGDDGRSAYLVFGATALQSLNVQELSPNVHVTIEGEWLKRMGSDSESGMFSVTTIYFTPVAKAQASLQATSPILGAQPWITILCKPLYFDTVPNPLAYYQDLFTSPEFPYLDYYFRELSYGAMNLSGSQVVGWYTLPQQYSYYYYDMDGDGIKDFDRSRLTNDCTLVADPDVYFPDYVGINLLFDFDMQDSGGSWYLQRDGVSRMWGVTWFRTTYGFEQSGIAHEMGHAFGLPHSGSIYGVVYDDPWDIMGDDGWGCWGTIPAPRYGCPGQHAIAYHKDLLGWIPSARKYMATWGNVATLTLDRLEFPSSNNYLMAQIPIGGNGTRFYTLETRQKVSYDQALPGNAVIIHEVNTQRYQFPAAIIDSDNNHNTGDAGTMWTPGESFIDTANGVTVCVNAATPSGFRVTVGLGITISCSFQPDLSMSNLWASPTQTIANQEVTFTTRLYNGGIQAQNVVVSSTIPNDMTYVPGSASTTQGSVSVGDPLVFSVGTLNYDSPVTITFAAYVNASVISPTVLTGPVQIAWQGGNLSKSHVIIANGLRVYLPLVSR